MGPPPAYLGIPSSFHFVISQGLSLLLHLFLSSSLPLFSTPLSLKRRSLQSQKGNHSLQSKQLHHPNLPLEYPHVMKPTHTILAALAAAVAAAQNATSTATNYTMPITSTISYCAGQPSGGYTYNSSNPFPISTYATASNASSTSTGPAQYTGTNAAVSSHHLEAMGALGGLGALVVAVIL